jgi:hypothetical protein
MRIARQVGGESEQESQLLYPQVCLPQVQQAFPSVGCLYQRLQYIVRGDDDSVAQREFMGLWELHAARPRRRCALNCQAWTKE